MKRTDIILVSMAAALALCECAKTINETDNDANKRYIEAWMSLNYPEAYTGGSVCDGIWVVADEPGTGEAILEDDFAFVNYRAYDLNKEISESTFEEDARRLGTFSNAAYYGPKIFPMTGSMVTGLREAITGGNGLDPMKVGGKRTVVIPNWLNSTNSYKSADEYFKNVTGTSPSIYEIELTDFTSDIVQYEADEIEKFLRANGPSAFIKELEGKDWGQVDSTGNGWGFYYRLLASPDEVVTKEWANGDKIYINYTGRLLNGKVFDTTIRDTARFYGIESKSKKYEPVQANMSNEYTDITLTSEGTSVIDGFSFLISKMKPYEKALGVFCSDRGYKATGTSPGIPGYAPLIFEVEITTVESND